MKARMKEISGEDIGYLKLYPLVKRNTDQPDQDILDVKAEAFRVVVAEEQVQNVTNNLFWPRGIHIREWQFPEKAVEPGQSKAQTLERNVSRRGAAGAATRYKAPSGGRQSGEEGGEGGNDEQFTPASGSNRKRHRERIGTSSPSDILNKRPQTDESELASDDEQDGDA